MDRGLSTDRARHRGQTRSAVIALFLLSGMAQHSAGLAQIPSAVAPSIHTDSEVVAVLRYYLDADCGTAPNDKEEQRRPFGALRKLLLYKDNPTLEARLTEILQVGVYPDDAGSIRATLGKQWEDRQAIISRTAIDGAKNLRSNIGKREYVDRKLGSLVRMYRQKAAVALVALDTENGRVALAQAVRKDPVLLPTVRTALGRFGGSLEIGGVPAGDAQVVPLKKQ